MMCDGFVFISSSAAAIYSAIIIYSNNYYLLFLVDGYYNARAIIIRYTSINCHFKTHCIYNFIKHLASTVHYIYPYDYMYIYSDLKSTEDF